MSPSEARDLLVQVTSTTEHVFWADDWSLVEPSDPPWLYVVGHRQVTDAYLLELARRHLAKLATLDLRISALLPDARIRGELLEVVN